MGVFHRMPLLSATLHDVGSGAPSEIPEAVMPRNDGQSTPGVAGAGAAA
jgi:hypothetical protein